MNTLQINAVHVLNGLAARFEYVGPLRGEILEVIHEDGLWETWQKNAFSELKILDASFTNLSASLQQVCFFNTGS